MLGSQKTRKPESGKAGGKRRNAGKPTAFPLRGVPAFWRSAGTPPPAGFLPAASAFRRPGFPPGRWNAGHPSVPPAGAASRRNARTLERWDASTLPASQRSGGTLEPWTPRHYAGQASQPDWPGSFPYFAPMRGLVIPARDCGALRVAQADYIRLRRQE